MSLHWKSRTFVAVTTASLLTAAGVVTFATAASGDGAASPTSTPAAPATPTSTAGLERSLADLLAQVDGLEAAVAASDAAALPADDNGGSRQPGVSDDPSAAPAGTPTYDDHSDGDRDGDGDGADYGDDHGSDDGVGGTDENGGDDDD